MICLGVSLRVDSGYGFWEEDHRSIVLCSIFCQGHMRPMCLSTADVDLGLLVWGQVCQVSPLWSYLPFSPFSLILLFGRKSLSPSHIQIGGRGLSSTSMAGSIYRNYLEFSCNEILPLLHICLFILFHLYQYGVMYIYVILWFITHFNLMNFWLKVLQLWLEEPFWLAHVHFWYTSINVCVCFRTLFFDITRYSRLIFLTQNQTFLHEVPVLSIIGNWY